LTSPFFTLDSSDGHCAPLTLIVFLLGLNTIALGLILSIISRLIEQTTPRP